MEGEGKVRAAADGRADSKAACAEGARAAAADGRADSRMERAGAESAGAAVQKRKIVRTSQLIAPPHYGLWRDVRAGKHREYWLRGGRGSGKSSFISAAILCGMLKHPEASAIIYRRVAATLRESVYEQMVWAIERFGLRDYFELRLTPLEIRYIPTGQKILFRGADNPGKSKSLKLSKGYFGYLWFEELAEFGGMESIRTIRASVLRGGGQGITFCSYNPPPSAQSWVNAEALLPREGRLVHSSSYLDLPRAWLGEAFLTEAELLKAEDGRAYRHMYLGEASGSGGGVFENLHLRTIAQEEIDRFGAVYAGLDFGWFPDPLHFVRCAYDAAQRRLWVFDEYRTLRTSNQDVFNDLREKKGLSASEEVIADSADMKSIGDMRSYGMRCMAATKGPGSVRASIRWLQGLREIVIDPNRCPAAAREFSEYEYERGADGGFVEAYPDRNNHAIDAVRYATNRIWLRSGA